MMEHRSANWGHLWVVGRLLDDLGGHPEGRANKGVSLDLSVSELSCHAEVRQLHLSLLGQQHIGSCGGGTNELWASAIYIIIKAFNSFILQITPSSKPGWMKQESDINTIKEQPDISMRHLWCPCGFSSPSADTPDPWGSLSGSWRFGSRPELRAPSLEKSKTKCK